MTTTADVAMGMTCGTKCIKVLLISFNMLLWVCGCAMVVTAAWVFVSPTVAHLFRLASTRDVSPGMIYHVAYTIVALGCAVLLVGFFGCCGAVQGSKCMLAVFLALLFLLLCLEVTAAVATLVVRDKFLGPMEGRLAQQLADRYGRDTHNNSAFTEAIDLMQFKLHCCGINGDVDYNASRWKTESQESREPRNVPLTCCNVADDQVTNSGSPISVVSRVFGGTVEERWQHPQPKDEQACQDEDAEVHKSKRHTRGCFKELEKWFKQKTLILTAVLTVIAVFKVFGIMLAICLYRDINSDV